MKFKLARIYLKPEYTIGKLYVDEHYLCDTLERPWLDNQTNISCIPKGIYQVKMLPSQHFQRDLPHILNVPDRTDIMIHPANFVEELKGCVAVGRNTIKGGLIESAFFCNLLNKLIITSGEEVELEIV